MITLVSSGYRKVVYRGMADAGGQRRPLRLAILARLATLMLMAVCAVRPLVAAAAPPIANIDVNRDHANSSRYAGTGPVGTAVASGSGRELAQSPQAAASQALLIHIKSFAFGPAVVTIEPGQQVTWVNDDPVPHTATGADKAWDTGQLQPGTRVSVTFTKPGTYVYNCTVHPFMQATVVVR